jgi:hypothetical protein
MVELGFSDNELDEKFHNMTDLAIENPPIQKVIDNQGTPITKVSIPILYPMDMFSSICDGSKEGARR